MVEQKPPESGQNLQKRPFKSLERRYLPRWVVSNKVLYRANDNASSQECVSKDISCNGISIVTDELLPTEQKVKLTIYLEGDLAVRVEGSVIWNRLDNNHNLIGLNFLETSTETQELILKHAFELRKDDLVKHWYEGWQDNKNPPQQKFS